MNYLHRGGGGGGGGGGYPLDYHNYPTAPRNYPLNYPQQNSSQHYPKREPSYPQESYRNQENFARNRENYDRNQENYARNRENYDRNQENYARNREMQPQNFSSLSRNLPPSYRNSQKPDFHRHSTHLEPSELQQRPFRTVDDYHHAYRGGYRPSGADTDGYTTDGSGSGYRDNSGRVFENYRYPEKESLLPRYMDGNTYPRGEGAGSMEGEKAPFLTGVEPVRLTPSWENTNLPKEELNFRGVSTYENFEMSVEPPRDRYKLVFLTLVLHGVGTLMPWNMFITAKNYFVEYKLDTEDENLSTYSTNFLPYIGYAAQIPNVICNWLNVFMQMGGNLTSRIVWSLLVEVVVFVITVVLAMIDSSEWPGAFFWITIVSVVILNVAGGIYQNTVYGMAARLPASYTGAVVLGSNISGTFTALINILAIALAPNTRTSAIYYFITALFVLLACFDTYFALPLNRFFRYHEGAHERAQKVSKTDRRKPRIPYWHVFKSAFPQLFNVFMVFFVSLSVFPAVLADTCRTEENFPISPKYFQAVTCFLTFNLFAMIGNMLPALFTWPGPRFLCIPVLLRLLLIPAFVLCHFYPVKAERIMPVLIDSDWAYWVLSLVLGITSGYYSSLALMYCPRTVEPEYAPVAGMMGAASLITGIFSGIVFQIVCTYTVTNLRFEIPGYEFPFRNCTNRFT